MVGNTEFLASTVIAEEKLIIGQNKVYDCDHPAIQYRQLLLKSQWEFCILKDCKMIPLNLPLFLYISLDEVIPLALSAFITFNIFKLQAVRHRR